jgi:subtilisin family serine protease
MRVRAVWAMGFSGRGVSVSILDDGIQLDHPDLAANYVSVSTIIWTCLFVQDAHASTDINGHDSDPTPRDNGDNKLVQHACVHLTYNLDTAPVVRVK